jgi:Tfp pilus assembly protein PilF
VFVPPAAAQREMNQNHSGELAAQFQRAVEHQRQGRAREALESYDAVLRLNPEMADAHCNRGIVLQAMLGRPEEALTSFDRAIALNPRMAMAHHQRGNTLRDLGRLEESLENYDRALALKPDAAMAHNDRGNVLRNLHRWDEAILSYERAIELNPAFGRAAFSKAMCLLQTGNFTDGLPLYEWRKKKPGARYRQFPRPVWSGAESLDGKKLFLIAEQGLGDTIQFSRYALLAREKGAKVILAVQDVLVRLMKGLGPEIGVVGMTSHPPEFDCHAALLSMPLAFGTNLSSCPASVPYLRAEPDRIEHWRTRLGRGGFKIGICWQGKELAKIGRGRSFSVRHFEGLAKLPGVRLISLQKGDGVEQLRGLPPEVNVETLGEDFDVSPDAFIDTAAVMEVLDLVITTDTAIAHLAGALGRPTWVALKNVPDWRWFLGRTDSPWYPTMRLFRQSARDDWAGVFAAMESQLAGMLGLGT